VEPDGKKEEEDSPVKICLGTKIQKGESIRRLEEDIPS
jgi:LacI family transcriptional regulator